MNAYGSELRFTKRSVGGWFIHYGDRRLGYATRAGGCWHVFALMSDGTGRDFDGRFATRREAAETLLAAWRQPQRR